MTDANMVDWVGPGLMAADGFTQGQEVWFWEIKNGIPKRQYGRINRLNVSNQRALVKTLNRSGEYSIHRDDIHPLDEKPVVDTTLHRD